MIDNEKVEEIFLNLEDKLDKTVQVLQDLHRLVELVLEIQKDLFHFFVVDHIILLFLKLKIESWGVSR